MKNIYTFVTGLFLIFSLHLAGQTRIYAPDLRAPENGETGVVPDVLLDWDAVTGGTTDITYELQLDVTDDFANAVTFPVTNLTALEMNELLFGTTYYWHVKAFDSGEPSDWSETWSFTVVSSVVLLKPNDGASVFPDPTISWKPIDGLTAYELQIDTTYLWSAENPETTEDLNGSFIVDANNKWIVGDGGFVAHFDGTSWNTVDAGTEENLNGVFFTAANNGWIVGNGGTLLHYDGTSWTAGDSITNSDLLGVFFLNGTTGWVVGKTGSIFKYNGNWTPDTVPENIDNNTVFALSANNVFVGAKSGYIFHYDGSTWDETQLTGKKDVYSLWFTDANNGWAVGKSGKIFYYNGSDWTNQPSGIFKDLYGVSFSGNTGFAVGKSGNMLRYSNGEWESVASGSSSYLNSIYLSGNDGIVVGNDGTLLKKAGEGFTSPYAKIILASKDSSEVQLSNLLFGKTFYYRLRAVHSQDTSNWSVVKSMSTYSKPTLTSPANNASEQPLLLTFKWDKFSGVIKYTIETSENANFQPALIYYSNFDSIEIDNFGFNKTYYWRVNTINADDVSDWSEVYTFSTANTTVLIKPADGEINVNKSPRFEWEGIEGTNKYQILVATDSLFTDAIINITDKAFFQYQSNLKYITNYYWKVRGIVGLDTSGWSPVWQFVTKSPEGLQNIVGLQNMSIYPNPNHGTFQLTVNSTKNSVYTLSILDMQGKQVFKEALDCKTGKTSKQLNLNLRQGIYSISLSDGKSNSTKMLFVK